MEEWLVGFLHGAAMDAISLGLATSLKYGSRLLKSASSSSSPTGISEGSGTEFDKTLKALLVADQANKVSEEDVFSALVQERIGKSKGQDALKGFQDLLGKSKDALKKADGFIPVEDATKDALRKFRDSGAISKEEADSIYSQAFAGAQLDSNSSALYDNRGGAGDPTIAVAAIDEAMRASRTKFAAFDEGGEVAAVRSLDEPSAGKPISGSHSESGSAGFLFKPISDSDGRLAVLLPSGLAGLVAGVKLVDSKGNPLETGRYSGNGNGGRDHFRFTKPGGDYPDALRVEITLKTGELVRYFIQETSERTENISPDNGNGSSGDSSRGRGGSGSNQQNSSPDNSL